MWLNLNLEWWWKGLQNSRRKNWHSGHRCQFSSCSCSWEKWRCDLFLQLIQLVTENENDFSTSTSQRWDIYRASEVCSIGGCRSQWCIWSFGIKTVENDVTAYGRICQRNFQTERSICGQNNVVVTPSTRSSEPKLFVYIWHRVQCFSLPIVKKKAWCIDEPTKHFSAAQQLAYWATFCDVGQNSNDQNVYLL